jgi:hypothetical protein
MATMISLFLFLRQYFIAAQSDKKRAPAYSRRITSRQTFLANVSYRTNWLTYL